MSHLLLTGAGFTRNWGGWLASEIEGEPPFQHRQPWSKGSKAGMITTEFTTGSTYDMYT